MSKILNQGDRFQFDSSGFLVLKDVLSPEQVSQYRESVLALRSRYNPEEILSSTSGIDNVPGRYTFENILEDDSEFIGLMDHPIVLPIIEELMGGRVIIQASQGLIRPKSRSHAAYWHRDGPTPQRQFESLGHPVPLMTIKAGFFLTDIGDEKMGNLVLVPGSHRAKEPIPDERLNQVEDLPSSLVMRLDAGDVVLFHNAIWHAVSQNTSNVERVNIYVAYAYPWMRPWDYFTLSDQLKQKLTSRQRWMFGDFVKSSEAYTGRRRRHEDGCVQTIV